MSVHGISRGDTLPLFFFANLYYYYYDYYYCFFFFLYFFTSHVTGLNSHKNLRTASYVYSLWSRSCFGEIICFSKILFIRVDLLNFCWTKILWHLFKIFNNVHDVYIIIFRLITYTPLSFVINQLDVSLDYLFQKLKCE